MANHKQLVPFILKWEGGFVNDPDDAGGATYKGVTYETYKAYCRKKGYPVPTVSMLAKMPQAHWEEIFKTMYWDRWRADEIKSQSIANILVDWVWASGAWGIRKPQELVGVLPDGIVGAKTLAAVNSKNPQELFEQIKAMRVQFIDDICRRRPANKKFKRGWLNRINDLKYEG